MSDIFQKLTDVSYLVDNLNRAKNCVEDYATDPELAILNQKVNDALVHAEHWKNKLTEKRDLELYPE